ncbi:hypothetical protein SprV_0602164600 [Sparganum proliferum]
MSVTRENHPQVAFSEHYRQRGEKKDTLKDKVGGLRAALQSWRQNYSHEICFDERRQQPPPDEYEDHGYADGFEDRRPTSPPAVVQNLTMTRSAQITTTMSTTKLATTTTTNPQPTGFLATLQDLYASITRLLYEDPNFLVHIFSANLSLQGSIYTHSGSSACHSRRAELEHDNGDDNYSNTEPHWPNEPDNNYTKANWRQHGRNELKDGILSMPPPRTPMTTGGAGRLDGSQERETAGYADRSETKNFFASVKVVHGPNSHGAAQLLISDGITLLTTFLQPSLSETVRAMPQLSRGKALGSSAVLSEVYKHGGPRLMYHFTTLSQKRWR